MDNEEKKELNEEQVNAVAEEVNEVPEKVTNEVIEEPIKEEQIEVEAEAKVGEVVDDKAKEKKSSKTGKIVLFSCIGGGVAIIALILIIVILANVFGKPSKGEAKKIVENYFSAINDKDDDEFLKLVDLDGYVIYKEEGEKKFNEKYKDKNKYIRKFMDKNDLDDVDEYNKKVLRSFKSEYVSTSYKYSLKEITDVKKSDKSDKLVLIKAKVKLESSYSDTTKVLRLYVTKVKGKYKVVSAELV